MTGPGRRLEKKWRARLWNRKYGEKYVDSKNMTNHPPYISACDIIESNPN
jgi:hypothetical protein